MPLATISAIRRSYSAVDPSHQWIFSGSQRAAHSSTHRFSFWFSEGVFIRFVLPFGQWRST